MSDLKRQRGAELRYHDRSLRHEFAGWREASQTQDKSFAKHKSQIERITDLLVDFLEVIDAPNVPAAFGPQETAYSHLLGIYRIWSYFRSKYLMRNDERLRAVLRCADELAWACYRPLRQKSLAAGVLDDEQLKEPPLVFFSSDATPFAQARTTPFVPEGLNERDIVDFAELLLSLPIPVVGMPWFQLNHLPALPVVAHEVGHAVEVDFRIEQPLERLFARLDVAPERHPAWHAWRKEIFADVFACLCTGPAFLLALIDFLVGDVEEIAKEERLPADWGDYPTRTLRIMLNLEVLARLGLLADGAQPATGEPAALAVFLAKASERWRATYPVHRMHAFEADVGPVVSTLLGAEFEAFGGTAVRDLVAYGRSQLVDSWHLSDDLLEKSDFPEEAKKWSYRVLAAAPALAYARDPQAYYELDAQADVLDALLAAIPAGVRDPDAEEDDEALIARKRAADRELGRQLGRFFRRQADGDA